MFLFFMSLSKKEINTINNIDRENVIKRKILNFWRKMSKKIVLININPTAVLSPEIYTSKSVNIKMIESKRYFLKSNLK